MSFQAYLERCNPFEIGSLTVLSGLTLTQRIAAGQYDWVNRSITEENFPHGPTTAGEWERRLFMFDRALSSDEVVDEMKRELWLPGQAEHTLASGAVFPEEQRQFPIIGLGSVAQAPPQLVVGQWLVCRLPVPGCPLLSLFLPMIFLGVFL